MGVKGLWRLLDGTGRPVDLQSLEGQILAVDISVWLNMAIKGMRDYEGHAMANAHLITLFTRICKLLYYGIKPIFVFDGKPPYLKEKTLRERRERRKFNQSESKTANEKVLQNFLKSQILKSTLEKSSDMKTSKTGEEISDGRKIKKKTVLSHEKDIYDLPPLTEQFKKDEENDDLEEEWNVHTQFNDYFDGSGNISSLMYTDVDSKDFDSLPCDIQYELLKDMKEVRKRRRTHLEAMPENSDSFSGYQITGLLEKRKISKKMENVEHKMMEENVAASSHRAGLIGKDFENCNVQASQLISDSSSHFIWMQNLKKLDKIDEESRKGENKKLPGHEIKSNQNEDVSDICSSTSDALKSPITPCENPGIIFDNSPKLDLNPSKTLPETNNLKKTGLHANRDNIDKSETPLLAIPDESQYKLTNSDIIPDLQSEVQTAEPSFEVALEPKFEPIPENPLPNKLKPNLTEKISINSSEVDNSFQETILKGKKLDLEKSQISSESDEDDFIEIPVENEHKRMDNFEPKSTASSKVELSQNVAQPSNVTTPPSPQNKIIDDEKGSLESVKQHENPWVRLNTEDAESFAIQLDEEARELKKMAQAKERASRDLSQSAQQECQELLQLFGLPYVTSPQEAEAQCAALELLGFTNGTITEDSDIWLFGGKHVIKSMFDSKHDPVSYQASDIESRLGLNRDRFICIALCSGSDYTCGIDNVGPVKAMEILKEFTGEGLSGLMAFKTWWKEAMASPNVILPKETKIKAQLRRVKLKEEFPSETVYKAYLNPVVDDSNSDFKWGFPDLDELRTFAVNVIGWTRQKVNETLLPLVKKMGQEQTKQTKITQYISMPVKHVSNSKKKSKRVQNAVAFMLDKKETMNSKSSKGQKQQKQSHVKKVEINLSESSEDD